LIPFNLNTDKPEHRMCDPNYFSILLLFFGDPVGDSELV
jgi:hypothetical protein